MSHVENDRGMAEAVMAGPHRGWSTFDEGLEGARFQRLHGLVSERVFDAAAADALLCEINALALSYGYGSADSHLCMVDGLTPEEIEADPVKAHSAASLDDPSDDDYMVEARKSEKALAAAAATDGARSWLRSADIRQAMMDSFGRGRDDRAANEQGSPARPR